MYIWASSAVHSLLYVGLDNAKITGLSFILAISSKISWVNKPPQAASPIKIVGLTVLITSIRDFPVRLLSRTA